MAQSFFSSTGWWRLFRTEWGIASINFVLRNEGYTGTVPGTERVPDKLYESEGRETFVSNEIHTLPDAFLMMLSCRDDALVRDASALVRRCVDALMPR